jgi:DNA-binding MarR family transcriptional regulator
LFVLPPLEVFATSTYLLQVKAIDSLDMFEAALTDLAINARQYVLLGVAASGSDLSQADIAMHLGVDATVLGKLVHDLETRGLLERRRVPEDRRRHELLITRTGKTLFTKAEAVRKSTENELFELLDSTERETLRKLLMKASGLTASPQQ